MNLLLAIILALVFAFLATMPFLFINTRLHENVNYSPEKIKEEKYRAYKRFIYYFILILIMLTIYSFLTD